MIFEQILKEVGRQARGDLGEEHDGQRAQGMQRPSAGTMFSGTSF